jgi:hypothetical protein
VQEKLFKENKDGKLDRALSTREADLCSMRLQSLMRFISAQAAELGIVSVEADYFPEMLADEVPRNLKSEI